jgi:hypothetical protein
MDRRLRDAVHVDQPREVLGMAVPPGREALKVQGLAAEDHRPKRQLWRDPQRLLGLGELAER